MENVNRSGKISEVDPADAETDLLKKYLKKYNQVIPSTRRDILRAVRVHLNQSGRTTITVQTQRPMAAYSEMLPATGAQENEEKRGEDDLRKTTMTLCPHVDFWQTGGGILKD